MAMKDDSVCGMQIEESKVVGQSEYLEQTYYFCSVICQTKFDEEPEKNTSIKLKRVM